MAVHNIKGQSYATPFCEFLPKGPSCVTVAQFEPRTPFREFLPKVTCETAIMTLLGDDPDTCSIGQGQMGIYVYIYIYIY